MGDTDSLSLDGAHAENAYQGAACIRIRYDGESGWAGVAWQHPPNNWGEQDSGFDLTGATRLELWARGEYGGEHVRIGVGLLGDTVPFSDSAVTSVDGIMLTPDWQRYQVPLQKLDLSHLKTGFVVTFTGGRSPMTSYLDSIRFVRQANVAYAGTGPVDSRIRKDAGKFSVPRNVALSSKAPIKIRAARSAIVASGCLIVVSAG